MATNEPLGGGNPGWRSDPSRRHQLRYWDGARWTDHVSDGGTTSTDPWTGAEPVLPGGGGRVYSLSGLGTALTLLLPICAAASLLFAVALFSRASLLEDLFSHSLSEIEDADNAVAGSAIIYLVLYVATGVVWIIWQLRFAKNARLLGQRDGLVPGWAVGGWFIPVGNLVLPELQLYQAARASDPDVPGRGRAPVVVIAWWVLYVVGGAIGIVSGRFLGQDEITDVNDIADFQSSDRLAAVGALVVIVSAIVALVMVRTLAARQRRALAATGQFG